MEKIELWHLVLLLLFFFGACGATGKLLLSQFQRHLDDRFRAQDEIRATQQKQLDTRLESIDSSARAEAGKWQQVERDLLTLRAELPVHYVRREDYIRGQSIIEAKLDTLASKMENVQLRLPLGKPQ